MSEQDPTTQQDRNWRQMEQKVEKLESEVTKYRGLALEGLAHRAGYDTKNGVTQLVLEKFAGQDEVDLTPDAFKDFAAGLDVAPNLAPAETTNDGGTGAGDDGEGNRNEQQMEQLQNQGDQLLNVAQPPTQPDINERIATAEQAGDIDSSIALKLFAAQGA
jgi:NOL1/NOP2/fmu family ribosome biogenesis protein